MNKNEGNGERKKFMKNFKKIMALIIAAVMIVSTMSVTAFAADTVDRKISVSNLEKDDKVTFYKVLGWAPTTDIATEKGMGMTIVNALVKAMNGKITCESQEDKGTTFVINFRWPYCYKDQVEKITTDYSILDGKHILLVENNAMSAEVAKQILESQGMSMDLAVNGKDGVEIFTHAMPHTYDAILMDIRMPLMDGIEATQIIRQSTHPESDIIPIIAMTADAFDEDRQRTRDAGMNAHITKPINPQELFTTLTNYLR